RRLENTEAVALRQLQIRHDDRGPVLSEARDGLGLVACFHDGMALRFERVTKHGAQRILVFYEKCRMRQRRCRTQRTHLDGTPARRACCWMSAIACVCCAISLRSLTSRVSAFSRSPAITCRWAGSSRSTKSFDSALIRLCSASA